MNHKSFRRSATSLIAMAVLVLALIAPAFGQRSFGRSGSFGGGSTRSSGGSSFGRSSGSFGGSSGQPSSSFGRSSSSGNSGGSWFGRGSTRTAPPPVAGQSSGPGSFGRSGSFGGSGRINSTSLGAGFNPPPSYQGIPYSTRSTVFYGGSSIPAFGYGFLGGYSLGMISSPWTHWMPFHPAFYVDPPSYYNGAYYAGGFSMFRFILGIVVIWIVIRMVKKLFFRNRPGGDDGPGQGSGGGFFGGKKIKYTVYK